MVSLYDHNLSIWLNAARIATAVILVSLAGWLLWTPVLAIIYGITSIISVILFPLRVVFFLHANLVIPILTFLWTNPLQDVILRVLEVLVWISVGGVLLIAMKPELIDVLQRAFAFLKITAPQVAQRTTTYVSTGTPLMYQAVIRLHTRSSRLFQESSRILSAITLPTEENNEPPTPPTASTIAPPIAPPSTVNLNTPQPRNHARGPRVMPGSLNGTPAELRDGMEPQGQPSHPRPRMGHPNSPYQGDAYGSVTSQETLPSYTLLDSDLPPPFRTPASTIRRQ